LFSGLLSHGVSVKVLYPRFLSHLSKEAAVRSSAAASALVGDAVQQTPRKVLPSLGASGAIYAAVTLTALAFPDAQVQPIFLPISVSITTGVGALVLADIVGVLRGWQ
jgi:rhomboid-like protein